MADDPGKTPTPRPRRRRSDWDPTYTPPTVKHERRRSGTPRSGRGSVDGAGPAAASGASGDTPPTTPASSLPPFVPTEAAAGAAASDVDFAGADAADPDLAAAAVVAAVSTNRADDTIDREAGGGEAGSWLAMLDDRSPNAWVCPFFRSIGDDGRLRPPVEAPNAANRCAALPDAVPQSTRQQELVCLSSGHVNCPRYLRGAAATTELPPAVVTTGRSISPAILVSLVILVVAFTASIGFVVARGGMELAAAPTGSPAPSAPGAAVASPSAAPSRSATPTPTPIPTVSRASTAPSTSEPTAEPTPEPTAEPTAEPTPEPEPTAEPEATSDRYRLLSPCPDTDGCWIYVVRSGDNLYSIANYFGVPLETIYDWNPWTRTQGLRAGRELRLPPPTR